MAASAKISVYSRGTRVGQIPRSEPFVLWQGDVGDFLNELPCEPLFDLVVTSPPYNLGKEYESRRDLAEYLEWQKHVITACVLRLKPTGSVCWQVGNHILDGKTGRGTSILPLDMLFHPIFDSLDLKLRNRIIWRFGHGLHCKYRFSGRYETVLWYTRTDDYVFNLSDVLVPQKYPGKKHYKGPRAGQYSCNPDGKNPEDVWDIPNVKSNHIEKTAHPCQFPVALVERLIRALTNENALVFDPFAGVASSGVAAAITRRRFWGAEISTAYLREGQARLRAALNGSLKYRPIDKPIYDHTQSTLSQVPNR